MNKRALSAAVLACAIAMACALAACGGAGPSAPSAKSLASYPKSDLSSYDCAAGYDKEYQFVDMTAADIKAEMDKGSSFAVYCGYNHCPWCNSVVNELNDVLLERGEVLGYLDTRKNPAWQSNMDIDNYDTFVEMFGDVLPVDNDGKKHLYVPHVFFVKDGKLVADYPGTVPSQASPSDPLTEEQLEEYRTAINTNLDAIC